VEQSLAAAVTRLKTRANERDGKSMETMAGAWAEQLTEAQGVKGRDVTWVQESDHLLDGRLYDWSVVHRLVMRTRDVAACVTGTA